MMEQIDLLQKLQQNESRCCCVHADMQRRDARCQVLEDELCGFKASVAAESEKIDDLRKAYRNFESDTNLIVSQIKKSEVKLRAVKNNKEYQLLLKEIDDLKNKQSTAEDEMIRCLETIDTAQQAAVAKEAELQALSRRIEDEKECIAQQQAQAKKEIAALAAQWKKMAQGIDASLMATFEKIKAKQADGVAIVRVENAVCLGCNVNLPPQMYNELQRKDSFKLCPNCQRIIYWQADGI